MSETNIKVAVRIRPPLPNELVQPKDSFKLNKGENTVDYKGMLYTFDQVFSDDVNNQFIYKTIIEEKIRNLFNGINVTILAYGTTGSGKTHTMGTASRENVRESDPGLIPQGLLDIFKSASKFADEYEIDIKASFYELYCEAIKDLLDPSKTCKFRGYEGKFQISNLSEHNISSVDEALAILEKGNNVRTTTETTKNKVSSRSHAIFSLLFTTTNILSGEKKVAKFLLVDLAGSERLVSSSAQVQKESININKSLFTLSRVISNLVDKSLHVPFRESILTQILRDAFGGNSVTLMIACLSPSFENADEAANTLRFASNAMKIKNRPVINKPRETEVEELKKKLRIYEIEINHLRGQEGKSILPSQKQIDHFELKEKLADVKMKLFQAEEKNKSSLEKIEAVNTLYNSIYTEYLNAELKQSKDLENLGPLLEQLKKLLEELYEILVLEDKSICVTAPSSTLTTPSSSFSSEFVSTSELEHDVFIKCAKDEEDEKRLKTMETELRDKETEANYCKDLLKALHLTCSAEKEKDLHYKISKLEREKAELIQSQELSKAKMVKINNEKIETLESKIIKLKKELEATKKIMKIKKDNELKEISLKNEILNLKQSKVKLMKQIKEDASKQQSRLKEECKKTAVLEKEQRQCKLTIQNMKATFDKQLNVLKKKFESVQAANKRREPVKRIYLRKETPKTSKKDIFNDDTIAFINQLLTEEIEDENAKETIECYKKEASTLLEQIKTHSAEESLEESNAKELLAAITSKVAEMEQKIKDKKPHERWSFVTSTPFAKEILEYLFKKYVGENLDSVKTVYSAEIKKKVKEEYTAELNEVKANYEQKLESLNQDWEAKMEVMRKPKGSYLPSLIEKQERYEDMLDEFLEEEDEKYSPKKEEYDPDFRGTPMYKRAKTTSKRKLIEVDRELEVTPSKRHTAGCSCPSDCKSIRCGCKKKKIDCSAACECSGKCMNSMASTSAMPDI